MCAVSFCALNNKVLGKNLLNFATSVGNFDLGSHSAVVPLGWQCSSLDRLHRASLLGVNAEAEGKIKMQRHWKGRRGLLSVGQEFIFKCVRR